jgi:hypothetical protein
VAVLAAAGAAVVAAAPPARAADRLTVLRSAEAYGPAHGYRIGIAVYDTKIGRLYRAGYTESTFASESVVKAMIATRILLQGRMHGTTATRAYKMITQSDDAIASSFYGSVGGDGLITWIKRHYGIPDLGSPPRRAGWWGNTHITPAGLVTFYAKVKRDTKVGPWLLNAMHHAQKYGSDGTYQFFGLPSATSGAAVKQGWGLDYDDWSRSADFNTTGYVNGDRYAVAILARGPARTYGSAIGNALTQTARRLLPGGRFPEANPVITTVSQRYGTIHGGQRLDVRGTDFSGATAVWFGGSRGTSLSLLSASRLLVTTPAHAAGRVSIRVATSHGWSSQYSYYTYGRPAAVKALDPSAGPPAGGTTVKITGTDFVHVWSLWFGSRRATRFSVVSPTTIVAVAPAGTAGAAVHVKINGWYGWSSPTSADLFSYAASPALRTSSPAESRSVPTPAPTSPASGSPPTSSPAAGAATGSAAAPSTAVPASN